MKRIHGHYTDKDDKQVKFDFEVASSWEELELFQTEIILQILTYRNADRFTISASLMILLCKMHWMEIANLPDEELHALAPITDFLFETQPPAKNLYPKLKVRKKEYFPPADDLSNIGFGEWCFAYEALHNYNESKDKSFLDKLIMILYRPADPGQRPGDVNYTGDIREKFNENLFGPRSKGLGDMHFKIKETILAWFAAALWNIMSARPSVFPVLKTEMANNPSQIRRTWFDVFRELLGPKWGTTNELKYTNAIFVLDYLEERERERLENRPVV